MPTRRGAKSGRPCPQARDQAASRLSARASLNLQTASNAGPTFTLFPKLPIELRLKIWKDAIPKCELVRLKVIHKKVGRQSVDNLTDSSLTFILTSSGNRSQRWIQDLLEVSVSAVTQESRLAYLKYRTVALPTTHSGTMRFDNDTVAVLANPCELFFANELIQVALVRGNLAGCIGGLRRLGVSLRSVVPPKQNGAFAEAFRIGLERIVTLFVNLEDLSVIVEKQLLPNNDRHLETAKDALKVCEQFLNKNRHVYTVLSFMEMSRSSLRLL